MLDMEFPPLISCLRFIRTIFIIIIAANVLRLLQLLDSEVKDLKRGYDHQGMAEMLGKCIETHNLMVSLENEMEQCIKDDDPTWSGLRPDLELFEKSLDSLLLRLKTYQSQYEIRGGLTEVTKLEFKRTIIDSLLPELAQNFTDIMVKRDAFIEQKNTYIQKLTKSYGRYKQTVVDVLAPAIIELANRGLSLNINADHEKQLPDLFEFSILQDLHSLFEELDLLYEIEMEKSSKEYPWNDWLPFSTFLRGSTKSTNVLNPDKQNSFKEMKDHEIPIFYTRNKKILRQFLPWMVNKTSMIHNASIAFTDLMDHNDKEFRKLFENVVAKCKETNALVREVSKYRIFVEFNLVFNRSEY